MKLLTVSFLIVMFSSVVLGQSPKTSAPSFDIADFNRKFEVAQWLVEYDTIAWKTTDVLMALPKDELTKLGQEWFCFQDAAKAWHAVYGRISEGKYEVAFHYVVDREFKITRTQDKIDTEFLNAFAQALSTARGQVAKAIPANSPRLNQYIKRNPDKGFTVWLFPAFQPDSTAVFGGEFIYTLDPTGAKILKDESYFQGSFRGFKTSPPREIWLNFREQEKPSLGAIFFVWYYKSYFTSINIDNAKYVSTVIKNGDNGYIWLNVEKEDKKVPLSTAPPPK